jgi:hypothetical protein
MNVPRSIPSCERQPIAVEDPVTRETKSSAGRGIVNDVHKGGTLSFDFDCNLTGECRLQIRPWSFRDGL